MKLKALSFSLWLAAGVLLGGSHLFAGELILPFGSSWQYDYQPGGLDRAHDYTGDGVADDWIAKNTAGSGFLPIPGHFGAAGVAPLGYGATQATTLTFADTNNKPITAYFRRVATMVGSPGSAISATLRLRIDDACVVYLNGHEVCRRNLPGGPITASDLALVDVTSNTTSVSCISPSLLVQGDNYVTCEVHQSSATSADLSMDCELEVNNVSPIPRASISVSVMQSTVPWGAPATIIKNVVGLPAPGAPVFTWYHGDRQIPADANGNVSIPACTSNEIGDYRCCCAIGDACIMSAPVQLACVYPSTPRVSVVNGVLQVVGTNGDDEVTFEKEVEATFVVKISQGGVQQRVYTIPQSAMGVAAPSGAGIAAAAQAAIVATPIIDLGPGIDQCSMSPSPPWHIIWSPSMRAIGGGQEDDTLIVIDSNFSPTSRAISGWGHVTTEAGAKGKLTCGPKHAPMGCAPVSFSLNPPPSGPVWAANTMSNTSGQVSAIFPPLPGGSGPLVFSDGTFAPSDWTMITYTNATGVGSTATGTQIATGGNSGSYREIQSNLVVTGTPNGAVFGFHLKAGASYNPSVQGAISSINYSEDDKNLINGNGNGMAAGVAIRQNGKLYAQRSPVFVMPYTTFSNWAANAAPGLTATALNEFTSAGVEITTSHPDFSATGTNMEFGFWRGNAATGTSTYRTGIDNWRVQINRAVQPYNGTLVVSSPLCPEQTWTFPVTNGVFPTNLGELWCTHCPECVCPPDGMSLWLPLNEVTGNSTVNRAASAYPGTHDLSGPSFQPGFVNNSRNFGSAANRVKVPHYAGLNPGTGDFSVDCWVKRGSGTNSVEVILDHRGSAGGVSGWSLALAYGNPILQMSTASSGYTNYRSTGTVPNDGCWHLIAVTIERASSTGIKFYIDGNPAGTANPAAYANQSLDVTAPFYVGWSPIAGNVPFLGGIDEVEFFNTRALTPTEVMGLYQAFNAGKCWTGPNAAAPQLIVFDGANTLPANQRTSGATGPGAVTFGATAPGTISPNKVFTVKNNGTSNLVITPTIIKTGNNPTAFVASNVTGTLAPGISGTFTLSFQPPVGATGTLSAQLKIASNDPMQPFVINVSGPVLNITPATLLNNMASQIKYVGDNTSFTCNAFGTNLTYAWTKNGVIIPGEVTPTLVLNNLTSASAGTYACKVSGPNNFVTTTATLVIVEPNTATKNVIAGATATFLQTGIGPIRAWGPITGYAWQRNSSPLAASAHYMNTSSTTATAPGSLSIINCQTPADDGDYDMVVTSAGGSLTSGAITLSVIAKPVVTPMSAATLMVGQNVTPALLPVSAINNPVTFAISSTPTTNTIGGLPLGLSYNTSTGNINGTPTVAGTWTVKVTATNTAGTSTPETFTLTISPLPTGLTGTYRGILKHNANIGNDLGGYVQLTVTPNAGVTAAITIGAIPAYNVTGQVITDPVNGNPTAVYIPIAGSLSLSGTFDIAQRIVTGTLDDFSNGAMLPFSAALPTNAPASYAGIYTFAVGFPHFDPNFGNKDIPLGYSLGSLTVSSTGSVTGMIKLCDDPSNTPSTFPITGVVGHDGSIPVFKLLYTNTGSFVGNVGIHLASGNSIDTQFNASAMCWWIKKPQPSTSTTRYFKAGFDESLWVSGRRYPIPAAGQLGLNLTPGPGNAQVGIDDPLSVWTIAPRLTINASQGGAFTVGTTTAGVSLITLPSYATVPPVLGGHAKVSLSLVPGAGTTFTHGVTAIGSGTYELKDTNPLTNLPVTRKNPFRTIAVDSTTGIITLGYFLLEDLPAVAGETPTNTKYRSGAVRWTAAP